MTNLRSAAGVAGGFVSASNDQGLTVRVTAAIMASLCLVIAIAAVSLITLDYSYRNAMLSEQALRAALLEKDFTSLERDVLKYGILRTAESRKNFEGEIGDFESAIADADVRLEAGYDDELRTVRARAAKYVKDVNRIMASGTLDAAAEAEISSSGNAVDRSIEAIRKPAVEAANAMSAARRRTVGIVMVVIIGIAVVTGFVTLRIARGR